jgi:hypothetical protein
MNSSLDHCLPERVSGDVPVRTGGLCLERRRDSFIGQRHDCHLQPDLVLLGPLEIHRQLVVTVDGVERDAVSRVEGVGGRVVAAAPCSHALPLSVCDLYGNIQHQKYKYNWPVLIPIIGYLFEI